MTRVWTAQIYGVFLLAAGCAGDGSSFSEIEQTVTASCGTCHAASTFERLIDDLLAVEPGVFDADRFPDEMFPSALVDLSTADLIAAANPARDANLDPDLPDRQAWILHLLFILDEQLSATPPSDFTTEGGFVDYNAAGSPPSGCEAIDRLGDLAELGLPQQMPPLWADPLLDAIARPFAGLGPADRTNLIDNIIAGLPDGRAACLF